MLRTPSCTARAEDAQKNAAEQLGQGGFSLPATGRPARKCKATTACHARMDSCTEATAQPLTKARALTMESERWQSAGLTAPAATSVQKAVWMASGRLVKGISPVRRSSQREALEMPRGSGPTCDRWGAQGTGGVISSSGPWRASRAK